MLLGIIILTLVIATIIFLSISFYITLYGSPYSPTPIKAVHEMLKQAKIKKGDKVYDIGAGDGRIVHYAVKNYGADAIGFEMDPVIFFIAKLRQWFFKWKGKIYRKNFTKHNLSDADVVLCYMLPRTLKKFQKKFDEELKEGTKVISYAFHIGNWKPKKIIPKKEKINKIFIYEI